MPPKTTPEDAIQFAAVDYLDAAHIRYSASKNGANVGVRAGAIYKKRGVKKGWPDLTVVKVGARGEPGLYIEFKAPNGSMAPEQKEWQRALRSEGYACEVVKSFDSFIGIMKRYTDGVGPPFERTVPEIYSAVCASVPPPAAPPAPSSAAISSPSSSSSNEPSTSNPSSKKAKGKAKAITIYVHDSDSE